MRLHDAIQEYITHKRSLGMTFTGEQSRLRTFCMQVGNVELDNIKPEQIRHYLDGAKKTATAYWVVKYTTLKGFYRYVLGRHYTRHAPLPAALPKLPPSFVPYIYSVRDVQQLLVAAESSNISVRPLDPGTIRLLILLLYGSGLRIGEAARLTTADFDIEEKVLKIHETKFFKTRLVPIGADLTQILREYMDRRVPAAKRESEKPLLTTCDGRSITVASAEHAFSQLRAVAGIARSDGGRYQPRLHDFRHTFAVTRLVTWYREGKNVQLLLPHLSTYLGHSRICHTGRYLTMTKELLQEASRCFELYALPGGGL